MNKILKWRYIVIAFFGLLFILSAILFGFVKINYDNSKYLPDSEPTKQALIALKEEFGFNGLAQVMVKDVTATEADTLAYQLSQIGNVKSVVFNKNDINNFKDEQALMMITFEDDNYSESTKQALEDLKLLLVNEDFYLGGESVLVNRYSEVIQEEIFKILAFIIPIIIIILFFTTSSWIDPLLFLIVVAVSVIINMGSNIIFPNISYMTHATCGILQLALCMDYSVMLMHSYKKHLNQNNDPKAAIIQATKASFMPILGSALTTITSFVVLMFMRYGIGWDIGVVLAKGTIISLITSLLLMPCLLLVFANLIKKTSHRYLIKPNPKIIKTLIKGKWVLPLLAFILIGVSFYWQNKNNFIYGELTIAQESSEVGTEQTIINEAFGIRNQTVILIPKNESTKEATLITAIQSDAFTNSYEIKEITSVTIFDQPFNRIAFQAFLVNSQVDSTQQTGILTVFDMMQLELQQNQFSINEMITYITNTNLLTNEQKQQFQPFFAQITAVKNQLISTNYHRLLLTVSLPSESEETFAFVQRLRTILDDTFIEQTHIIGESIAISDMKEVVKSDYQKVSFITMAFIFLIIALSFVSISVPLLLVLLIEGAILINMAIPAFLNQNLLYIGYIIVSCIQLGATIDYGILYANRYLYYRADQDPKQSTFSAFEDSKTTVLTSGLILIIAGYLLGWVSSIPSIAVFGTLIGRGALISTLLVLFVLPETFVLFDKLIFKTTFHKKIK
ncbi:MAG: RND family transporter [Bacilli bacterium]